MTSEEKTCDAETAGYDGMFGVYCELPKGHIGPHRDGMIEWHYVEEAREARMGEPTEREYLEGLRYEDKFPGDVGVVEGAAGALDADTLREFRARAEDELRHVRQMWSPPDWAIVKPMAESVLALVADREALLEQRDKALAGMEAAWDNTNKAEARVGVLEGALRDLRDEVATYRANGTVVTDETLRGWEQRLTRLAFGDGAVLAGGEAAPERMTKDEFANYIRTGERGNKHLPTPEDHDAAIRECVADGTLDEIHLRTDIRGDVAGGEAAAEKCPECRGDGWQIKPVPGDAGVRCPDCKGSGLAGGEAAGQGEDVQADECHGQGEEETRERNT